MEGDQLNAKDAYLTPKEIHEIVKIAAGYGINKVKITGGEPLLRKDICEIIKEVKSVKEVKDVSLVSNGLLLEKLAYELKRNGLDRVNVSLPSLDPKVYGVITGSLNPVSDVEKVKRGIRKAIEAGLKPVKVNMVVLKGLNEKEIKEEIKFSHDMGVILQLIELQSINVNNEFFKKYHWGMEEIEMELMKKAEKVVNREMQNRKQYYLPDGATVEIVRPMHNTSFCKYCKRIRVTSDGSFKPCLMRNDNHVKFIDELRRGDTERVKMIFLKAVSRREPFFK